MTESPICRNCGAPVAHNFCAVCGQENRLHVPSALEFFHEFIGHYVALEGRLWQTMKLLLFKPGALTVAYLAGRRQRYVLPLRLFLTLSVIFFAVLRLSHPALVQLDAAVQADMAAAAKRAPAARVPLAGAAAPGAAPADRPGAAAPPHPAPARAAAGDPGAVAGEAARRTGADEPPDLRVRSDLANPWLQQKLDHFNGLPLEEKIRQPADAFFHYGPYAMFLLMPVFALYLKLLYLGSGRRYGEHLLFALHTNAMAYLILILLALLPFGPVRMGLVAWLTLYLPLALRRVYGGTWPRTLLRWGTLMFLHLISVSFAIVGAMALALLD